MIRVILLGLVAIAMVVIAPLVGASSSVSVDPDRTSSWLLSRPIIPELPEDSGGDQVERRDRRNREEQRNRQEDEEWRDRHREEWRDRREDWDDDEARDFFEDIFN